MTKINPCLDFLASEKHLENDGLLCSPSEVHGLVSGLVAGGFNKSANDWMNIAKDFLAVEKDLSTDTQQWLVELFEYTTTAFSNNDEDFQLLIPSKIDPLAQRSEHLVNWVHNFLAGLGVEQKDVMKLEGDIKEIVLDFTEITRMSIEVVSEHDSEEEDAFEEVVDYITECAFVCYFELHPDAQEGAEWGIRVGNSEDMNFDSSDPYSHLVEPLQDAIPRNKKTFH